MAVYSLTRWTRQLLRRHRKRKPSLIVHLFASQFRLEHTNGVFPYADSPMKAILEAIRDQRIPTHVADVLGQANIPFYDGCLIVQVHDHRHLPQNRPTDGLQPHVYRIVLAPDLDSIHADLSTIMDDPEAALEVEATVRALTAPKLCLSPDVAATRVANDAVRATTLDPRSLADRLDLHGVARQRRLSLDESQSANPADAQHTRLMRIGDDSQYRTFTPTFSRHSFIESWKQVNNNNGANSSSNNANNNTANTNTNNSNNTPTANSTTLAPIAPLSAALQQDIGANIRKLSTPVNANQSSLANSRKRSRQDSEPLASPAPTQPLTPSPALSAIGGGTKPKPIKQSSRQQRLKDSTRRIASIPQQSQLQLQQQQQQQPKQQQSIQQQQQHSAHTLIPQSSTEVLSQASPFTTTDLPVGVGLPSQSDTSLPVGVGLDFAASRPQMPSSSFNWAS